MTLRLALAFAGIVAAFPAAASSIAVLPATTAGQSPSIVHLGASSASPSSIALGMPAVEDIRVSSIGETQGQAHEGNTETSFRSRTPMVIRGGIVGEAFAVRASSTAAPVAQASEEQSTASPLRQDVPAEQAAPLPQETGGEARSGGLEAVR